jgi:hypothetical protein
MHPATLYFCNLRGLTGGLRRSARLRSPELLLRR